MTQSRKLGFGITLAAVAVALGAGFAVGRTLPPLMPSPATAAPIAADATAATPKRSVVSTTPSGPVRYKIPVTASQPSRGPADALVTVIEWCDLYGQACRRSDALLEDLLREHPIDVRRVYRHVPGPTEADDHAHELSRIAHEQAGKFWQVRAAFSKHDAVPPRAELERVAKDVGLDWSSVDAALAAHRFARHVAGDRVFAKMFRVQRAPALFVNGRRLEGELSAESLRTLVAEELAVSTGLVESGTPRADVYAKLIENAVWESPMASAR